MALIGSLALSIRAQSERLRQDLKPALDEIKRVGQAMMDAGMSAQEANREMARMRADAVRGPKAVAEATDGMRQKLQAAKQGAAALSGAISAMSSEVGGAVGHVTRLGTSLTSAFLAGGPVALGVTAVAAGFTAITGNARDAAEEIDRVTKNTQRMREESAKAVESMQEALERKRDELAVGRGQLGADEAAERAVAREFAARMRAAEKGIADERRAIQRWNDEARELGEGIVTVFDENEIEKRNAWIRQAQERIRTLSDELDAARKLAAIDREAINLKRTQAEEERKAKSAVAEIEKESLQTAKDRAEVDRQAIARNKELAQSIAAAYGMEAKMAGDAARAKEAAAAKADADSGMAAAEKRAEELRAVVEAEQAAAEAGKVAAAAAEAKAEAEKVVTEQVREQQRLVSKRPDITKRFGNVGGSMFGFGAGQAGTGIGDIGGDAARAARGAGPWSKGGGIGPLAASIAGGKGLDLPDPSAAIKAMEAEIAKIPPLFERLTGAVTGASATTRRVVGDLGRSTEKAVGALRSDQNAMEAEVRALARAIERAGAGNGAGD